MIITCAVFSAGKTPFAPRNPFCYEHATAATHNYIQIKFDESKKVRVEIIKLILFKMKSSRVSFVLECMFMKE